MPLFWPAMPRSGSAALLRQAATTRRRWERCSGVHDLPESPQPPDLDLAVQICPRTESAPASAPRQRRRVNQVKPPVRPCAFTENPLSFWEINLPSIPVQK